MDAAHVGDGGGARGRGAMTQSHPRCGPCYTLDVGSVLPAWCEVVVIWGEIYAAFSRCVAITCNCVSYSSYSYKSPGLGQAKPEPGRTQQLWLGLTIFKAGAAGALSGRACLHNGG
jgi:hypothetical protein